MNHQTRIENIFFVNRKCTCLVLALIHVFNSCQQHSRTSLASGRVGKPVNIYVGGCPNALDKPDGCLGFNRLLRQYFSLYIKLSSRERERKKR